MSDDITLRDTFAAAALTGLLVHANDTIDEETLDTPSDIAYTAYRMADAMLRERANHQEKPNSSTNHDAAPEATAMQSRENSGVLSGTGNTHEHIRGGVCDRSKPINAERLAALERLSAMDQELERTHGVRHTRPEGAVQGECSVPDSNKPGGTARSRRSR